MRIRIASHHPAGQMVKPPHLPGPEWESVYSNFEVFQRPKMSGFVYSIIRFIMNAFT